MRLESVVPGGINWSEEKNTTRKVGEGQVVETIAYWLRKLKFK